MPIKLTDELVSKTKKGKIASAKQVYLEGDEENLQSIGDKTHQIEDLVKAITVTGGASVASAVTYDHTDSGLTAVTAQGAIDELANKNKEQDNAIDAKADKKVVEGSLNEKVDKKNIQQALGDNEDMVPSLKLTKEELAKKVDLDAYNEKVTAIEESLDTKAVEETVNAELDKKFDKVNIASTIEDVEVEDEVPTVSGSEKVPSLELFKESLNTINEDLTAKGTDLDRKFEKENVDTDTISEDDAKVPSSKLVKEALDSVNKKADDNKIAITTTDGSLSELKNKVYGLPMQKVEHMTQSEYERLSSIDADTYYMCTEE